MNGSVTARRNRRERLTLDSRLRHGTRAKVRPSTEDHMPTQTTFDFPALRRGLEERDADVQLALYDEQAEVRLVDSVNPPRAPQLLRGRDEIRAWLQDMCSRDMTHEVRTPVVADDTVAFMEACRYPDGTNVLCASVLELAGGRIVRQVVVRAWDELESN
jgi:ketosteroid isomerase-like protein